MNNILENYCKHYIVLDYISAIHHRRLKAQVTNDFNRQNQRLTTQTNIIDLIFWLQSKNKPSIYIAILQYLRVYFSTLKKKKLPTGPYLNRVNWFSKSWKSMSRVFIDANIKNVQITPFVFILMMISMQWKKMKAFISFVLRI